MAGASTPSCRRPFRTQEDWGPLAVSGDSLRRRFATHFAEVRKRTSKPFNINLFVLEPAEARSAADGARARIACADSRRTRTAAGPTTREILRGQCGAHSRRCWKSALPWRALHSDILRKKQVAALKASGILVMGTATTVAEANAWEAVGADMVCAQGSEAGAHRGTFLGDFECPSWAPWRWCRKWWMRFACR